MFCGVPVGEETQAIIMILLTLVPASLYAMGLMEGNTGRYAFFAGLASHVLSMIMRGITVGTIPLTEKFDAISFMAFALALTYWYFSAKRGIRDLGLPALPLISTVLIVATAYTPINTVSPFQKTPWFFLHMFFTFVSYGYFGISACVGALYLIRRNGEYEPVQYQGAVQGWIMLSLALVAGSVWFFLSYGTYWLWTSKELWATLTWFYYGLYLHARYLRRLSGRPAAVIGIIGFFVALFTYFGVGTIIPAPPTQF